ncbi:MAG: M48 family metalloprotease [Pseudomonadota bacterium]
MRFFAAVTHAIAILAMIVAAAPAQAIGLIRDSEIERTLSLLAEPIFRAANLPPGQVEILIVDDSTPNAFVFGGRNMVFTTGLLRRFREPGQIQGVMAHEAGHLTGGHLARRAIAMRNTRGPAVAATILGILAAAASGQAGAGIGVGSAAQTAIQRALLAYTRGEEASADQAAFTFMERAGIDPEGLMDVMRSFRGQEVFTDRNQDPYARTHPMFAERMALSERRAAESPHQGKPPDPELAYWTERMGAKLDGFLQSPRSTLSRLSDRDDGEFDRLRRAVALHRLPDPDAAVREVEALIAMRPNDPYYHELKGQILLESGRGPEAVAPYRQAVALAPEAPLIRGYLGRALLSLGTPEADREALNALERGAALSNGGSPSLLRDLSFAYARTGEEGKAALASAERLALLGAGRDARRLAERAKGMLPAGSPAWLRADDIVASMPDDS